MGGGEAGAWRNNIKERKIKQKKERKKERKN